MDLKKRIAELEKTIVQLREQLVTDELTRLYNRRGLIDLLKPVMKEVKFQLQNPERRRNVIIRSFSLLFIDIDHFKKINDGYGHEAGDAALKKVTKILKENVRGLDLVGRWGGEEILIGLIGADITDGTKIAEVLRQKIIESPLVYKDKAIDVTASFGVAELKTDEVLDDLVRRADEALYKAKKTGRNRVVAAK